MTFAEQVADWFEGLQDRICTQIAKADGGADFKEDHWQRSGGGGGRSRVLVDGQVIEKGGVNFSAVHGTPPPQMLRALQLPEADFFATGVSIVLHPRNPMVPIIHMNVRYFEMTNGVFWFGGGIDLTPHYIVAEDARYFHQQLKAVCDRHHPGYYPKFKAWADDYFFLKHRHETRGIGGIFFDHLNESEEGFTRQDRWAFVQEVGETFAPIYTHFMHTNKDLPYTEAHQQWQRLRRGRYVEFNLVWDKGTKFGLDTGGRTESILMSLPPQADWQYDYQPTPDSPEHQTLQQLKKGIDWINDSSISLA
ncbi:MAG: oxygen-dependent coproporphyrinogen oxidase [Bernardetiaceae bacterium]